MSQCSSSVASSVCREMQGKRLTGNSFDWVCPAILYKCLQCIPAETDRHFSLKRRHGIRDMDRENNRQTDRQTDCWPRVTLQCIYKRCDGETCSAFCGRQFHFSYTKWRLVCAAAFRSSLSQCELHSAASQAPLVMHLYSCISSRYCMHWGNPQGASPPPPPPVLCAGVSLLPTNTLTSQLLPLFLGEVVVLYSGNGCRLILCGGVRPTCVQTLHYHTRVMSSQRRVQTVTNQQHDQWKPPHVAAAAAALPLDTSK
ncbi:hypothetical protein E2C01_033178 [Portunus trituberculatus]|uniref:Uncharacterized protein n=1 Tax=Portunus trituberculatus TaxID=210409 RepID=A0A5B7F3I8_PORTR|nr:hypothetical protein [Portunus trituberculatus]